MNIEEKVKDSFVALIPGSTFYEFCQQMKKEKIEDTCDVYGRLVVAGMMASFDIGYSAMALLPIYKAIGGHIQPDISNAFIGAVAGMGIFTKEFLYHIGKSMRKWQ